jgi:N,N-dimethylformamidase beta subunit-like protein
VAFRADRPGNRQSYVPLTVWDPASTATYVIKNDVFTWQAWNSCGGYDFCAGLGRPRGREGAMAHHVPGTPSIRLKYQALLDILIIEGNEGWRRDG